MISLGIIGGVMAVAGIGGAVAERLTRPRPPDPHATLKTCFSRARLYVKQKVDEEVINVYPTIHGHSRHDGRTEYSFTLPIGCNPDRLYRHMWVFHQGFGPHIDIAGGPSRFTLKVYDRGIEPFVYALSDIPLDGIRLPIVVGRSREGYEVYDMVEQPHLLIAGETGSGKSTQIRAILTTLMLSRTPEEVQFYLADLKRSEFHLFKGIPHVRDVVVETEDLAKILYNIRDEMKRRGDLCEAHEVEHVDKLPSRLPYIVVCVDEVALLQKEKDVMAIIEDISAIGRALGVFVILSMQRPDAKVLDGKLKQNLTVRMAFKHADGINSRITLGMDGAEDLDCAGLMLWKGMGVKKVQGPYLELEEARRLLKGDEAIELDDRYTYYPPQAARSDAGAAAGAHRKSG